MTENQVPLLSVLRILIGVGFGMLVLLMLFGCTYVIVDAGDVTIDADLICRPLPAKGGQG